MANGYKRPNSQTNLRPNSQTNLEPIKEESAGKNAKQNQRENNNSQQYQPQVAIHQTSTAPSVPHPNVLLSSNAQETSSQGQGQQGSDSQKPTDSLKGLLSRGPNEGQQAQQQPLPEVQVEPRPTGNKDKSSPGASGSVRVVPKFSIQGSDEEDEDSPPTPKGKFYI